MQILVFGDSITYGACDSEGGWVQRLRKFLDGKNLINTEVYYSVYNLGVWGNAIEDLLKRLEFETKQRIEENEEVMFVFAIGVNDSNFIYSKTTFKTPSGKFQK